MEQFFTERVCAGEEVDYRFMANILHEIVEVWNRELDSIKEIIRVSAGEDHDNIDEILSDMKIIKLSKSPQALVTQSFRICRRLGIRPLTNVKPMKHLNYEHPEMEAVRKSVQDSETVWHTSPFDMQF